MLFITSADSFSWRMEAPVTCDWSLASAAFLAAIEASSCAISAVVCSTWRFKSLLVNRLNTPILSRASFLKRSNLLSIGGMNL